MTDGAKAWILRASGFGEIEQFCFDNHRAINHWGNTGDLTDCTSPMDVNDLFGKGYPVTSGRERFAVVHQLWMFRSAIRVGDVIATPRFEQPGRVAIGVCSGSYSFVEAHGQVWRHHQLPVTWITTAAHIPTVRPEFERPLAEPYSNSNPVVEFAVPGAAADLLRLASVSVRA